MRVVLISVAFNLFWLLAVLGQHAALPYLVLALLVAFIVERKGIAVVLLIALVGIAGDSLLSLLGFMEFGAHYLPLWFCLLWVGFSAYVVSLRSLLVSKPVTVVALVGAFGGAASYLAGERLGAVTFNYSLPATLTVLFLAWFSYSAFILFVLHRFAKKESVWSSRQRDTASEQREH